MNLYYGDIIDATLKTKHVTEKIHNSFETAKIQLSKKGRLDQSANYQKFET